MRGLFLTLVGILFAPIAHPDEPRTALALEMVLAHNAVRMRVGVAPFVWSDRLAASAQEWANTLLARHQFFHRPKSAFGQNLFAIQGGHATVAQVLDAWAGESREYDYHTNKCLGVCGHYTQIVWADTKEVGCAVARSSTREVWVCEYDPPGNYVGRRPY